MNRMKVKDQWFTLLDHPSSPDIESVSTVPPPRSDSGFCKDCRYPSVGFLCKGADGRCLRSEMKRFEERRIKTDETK